MSVLNYDKSETINRAKRVHTADDRMAGNLLAQEAWATVRTQANVLHALALKAIRGLTVEGREAFIKAVDGLKKDTRNALVRLKIEGADSKLIAQRVNSATTRVSELRTIAKAWNSGATEQGCVEYVAGTMRENAGQVTIEDIGFHTIVEYARLFSESKAGRKPDTYAQKVAKFLERTKPEEGDKQGGELYDALVAMYNKLA